MTALALRLDTYLTRAAATLGVVCALSALLYGLFLLEAVAHTATRANAQRELVKLGGLVSSLEGEYLSQTQTLTRERAQIMGFVAPVQVSTVFAQAHKTLTLGVGVQ